MVVLILTLQYEDTKYGLALESSNVSVASGKIISNIDIDYNGYWFKRSVELLVICLYFMVTSNQTASSAMIVNSYLVAYVGGQNPEDS